MSTALPYHRAGVVLHPSHQESHVVHHARPRQGVQPVLRDVTAVQDAVHSQRQRLPSQQPIQVGSRLWSRYLAKQTISQMTIAMSVHLLLQAVTWLL